MAAPVSLIVQMAGPDRPGLVESLSTAISEADGNWEGSRMARLAGQFAGVVHVVVDRENVEKLTRGFDHLKSEGMLISVVEDSVGNAGASADGRRVELDVVGQDRTGIVKEISRELAKMGVNVEELTTQCLSAPMSGEQIFEAKAVIFLPEGVDSEGVRIRVEEIAQDLSVTIVEDL